MCGSSQWVRCVCLSGAHPAPLANVLNPKRLHCCTCAEAAGVGTLSVATSVMCRIAQRIRTRRIIMMRRTTGGAHQGSCVRSSCHAYLVCLASQRVATGGGGPIQDSNTASWGRYSQLLASSALIAHPPQLQVQRSLHACMHAVSQEQRVSCILDARSTTATGSAGSVIQGLVVR